MKICIRIVLLIFIAFTNSEVKSQLSTVNIAGDQFSGRIAFFNENKSKSILGSTYISEDWMFGSIETKSGLNAEGLFRLNALRKEIEMITGDDTLVLSETFDIKNVKLGGLVFVSSITIEESGKRTLINTHFLNLLIDGRIQLLKKFDVGSYHNLYVPNYMGGAGDGNTYYRMGAKYYYRINDGSASYPLKKKPRFIAELFSIEPDKLKEVIRDNKLNIQKEEDLKILFSILNAN